MKIKEKNKKQITSETKVLVCPKTGKSLYRKQKRQWSKWFFPILGLGSLIWFLLRVLPKPSRVRYPCQRIAMPMAFTFISYIIGFLSSVFFLRSAKKYLKKASVLAVICLLAGILSLVIIQEKSSFTEVPPDSPNDPIGIAKGINPGRVVWVYDPLSVSWDGSTGYWWEDAYNDQTRIDVMMSKSLRWLTSTSTDAAAWDALFKYFNQRHNKGDIGYQPGEKISVKINLNNKYKGDPYDIEENHVDASPHMVLAIIRQLVNHAGINQSDITIHDASRKIPDTIYVKCTYEFPNVKFVDRVGENGRIRTIWVNDAIHYSDGEPVHFYATKVTQCAIEADYIINMAILKRHPSVTSVTLCAKNDFGTVFNPSDLHLKTKPWTASSKNTYDPLVDLMGHKDIGGKTMLYLLNGLYGSSVDDIVPKKWVTFDNDWPSSIFASQDGVAIDSVGFDFIYDEWLNRNGNMSRFLHGDRNLHEAALANNPPSGIFYDPENDGTRLESLGVHEHWNNADNKQYSRNLGIGNGIELVTNGEEQENLAPCVNAGTDQNITLPVNTVNLSALVTDDGLPDPPGAVITTWSQVSGPGTVFFNDVYAVETTATFSEAGTYILRLTADDNELQTYDDIIITVNPEGPIENNPPVANDQTFMTDEDVVIIETLSASDLDGDELIYTIVANGGKGTAVITDSSNGTFTYSPNENIHGSDTFTFKVNDGLVDSLVATITIEISSVNDVSVADSQSLSIDEDTSVNITLTGTDVDGDTLSYEIVTQPSHGTLSGTCPDLIYTPDTNYNGFDSFTFKVNDGAVDSNIATVSITVNGVTDLPLAVDDITYTKKDKDVTVNVIENDTDPDGTIDPGSITIIATPSNGSTNINGDGTVTYTPVKGFIGTDSFTYTVKDNDGGTSNAANVTIIVYKAPGRLDLDRKVKDFKEGIASEEEVKEMIRLYMEDTM